MQSYGGVVFKISSLAVRKEPRFDHALVFFRGILGAQSSTWSRYNSQEFTLVT